MKIVIIGAGKVAWHLAQHIHLSSWEVVCIYNRSLEKAQVLAEKISAQVTNKYEEIPKRADIYLIAVSDHAIKDILLDLKTMALNGIIAHTSGATSGQIFAPYFEEYGVFYPLQSFSKEKEVDFKQIPICIDGNKEKVKAKLSSLAKSLSEKVYEVNDQQRSILHIAAVFANNFTNHLYQISKDLLEEAEIPFSILHSLILETAAKVQANEPTKMQTGPAVRSDWNTINRHKALLENNKEILSLYELLTERIIKNKGV